MKKLKVNEREICDDCRYWQMKFPSQKLINESILYYNEFGHEFMERAKFRGDVLLWDVISYLLNTYYRKQKKYIFQKVPSHIDRIKKRDFEHLEYLLKNCHMQCVNYLDKNENSDSQLTKKTLQNRRVIIDSFQANKIHQSYMKLKKIAIFDDVYTTGTTLRSCVKALNESKIECQYCLTIFRADLR